MHALPVVSRFAFLLAGLAAAPAAPAQPTTPPAAGYEGVAARLTTLVEREMRAKGIRALSLALVDGDRTVWAGGFGWARMADSVAATAETVYRVGSVSKLFTDVAVMQLVEQGTLALDAPISTLVPALAADAGARPITLRMLMAHRAGIQREPPVGHYFDTSGATLAATVASLHGARRPYPPGARTKYSNAGVAAVGRALEVAAGRPFTAMVTERVLTPVGMTRSGFALTPALRAGLAEGEMWTYDGRSFPAPVFELGMAPAGNLYSTANDLARFAAVLLARGRAPSGRLLSPAALDTMWTPQLATPGAGAGFGLGFIVGTLDGRRRLGHNGAVYGFATELAVLPDAGLAAVVIAAKDGANGTAARLADQALRLLLARRTGTFPPDDSTLAVAPDLATKLAGRWLGKTGAAELRARAGRLFLWRARGGVRLELRAHGDSLLVDDVVAGVGPGLRLVGDALIYAGDTLRRAPEPAPAPPPPALRGLVGEYGWDFSTLYLYEGEGGLRALIEWLFDYPLTVRGDTLAFPPYGLYHGEALVVRRAADGRVTAASLGGIDFPRRPLPGDGVVFRIAPRRPVDVLRREALAAAPPGEAGDFLPTDLVELVRVDSTIRLDVRYASTANFLGAPMYSQPRAFLQRRAAEALVRAHRRLWALGYGLLVHDAYRPWYVTKMFWEATPDSARIFVADPSRGSRHNRGAAVDLTLYDRRTGQPVEMPSGYDEFSTRAFPDYPGGTARQRWHRELLRTAMEAEGFTVFESEWWHFDHQEWRRFRIGNEPFERLGAAR